MSEVRHPEKINRVSNPIPKKPPWIRVKAPTSKIFKLTNQIIKDKKIVTVCEEAACPNISECWQKKHATFMILGDISFIILNKLSFFLFFLFFQICLRISKCTEKIDGSTSSVCGLISL